MEKENEESKGFNKVGTQEDSEKMVKKLKLDRYLGLGFLVLFILAVIPLSKEMDIQFGIDNYDKISKPVFFEQNKRYCRING